MAEKPQLSREYLYVPFTQMNMDVDDLSVTQIAFMTVGTEPTEPDWETAIAVDDQSTLFEPSIGEGLAILVGPDRGDLVTTIDLADGDHQVWIDAQVTGSDERIVRVAGILTISAEG